RHVRCGSHDQGADGSEARVGCAGGIDGNGNGLIGMHAPDAIAAVVIGPGVLRADEDVGIAHRLVALGERPVAVAVDVGGAMNTCVPGAARRVEGEGSVRGKGSAAAEVERTGCDAAGAGYGAQRCLHVAGACRVSDGEGGPGAATRPRDACVDDGAGARLEGNARLGEAETRFAEAEARIEEWTKRAPGQRDRNVECSAPAEQVRAGQRVVVIVTGLEEAAAEACGGRNTPAVEAAERTGCGGAEPDL